MLDSGNEAKGVQQQVAQGTHSMPGKASNNLVYRQQVDPHSVGSEIRVNTA